MERKQLKPYQGILVFVLVILMLLFAASPIQMRLGMAGVAITELLILLFGIIPVFLFKANLKEVMPLKVPKPGQIMGVIIMWIGSLMAVLLVTMIIGYFFPEGLHEVSSSLSDTLTSVPMWLSFLIIAVSPAICEEVLVRGFILSSFSGLKNKWITVIIVGVLFGIFHLDFYRFLPTAILGLVLSYIMIETKNLLLPAFFHLVNNGFSTLVSFLTPKQVEEAASNFEVPLISIGVYFILTAGAPVIFYLGSRLLRGNEQRADAETAALVKKKNRTMLLIMLACSFVMAAIGFAITVYAVSQPGLMEMLEEYSGAVSN